MTVSTPDTASNPITRRLDTLIYVSLGISSIIFACSMVLLGSTSLWLSEAGFVLTAIHHGTILYSRRKQARKSLSGVTTASPTLPASSTKFSIFAAWVIALVWTAALGFVIFFTILLYGPWAEGWESRSIAVPFELAFLVVEVPVMVTIALWCARERRLLLEVPANARWYRLSPKDSAA